MREVTDPRHPVKQEEHVLIPVADGTRLSARIWRPYSSDDHPVPAVLETIPYRKRDLSSVRDSIHHPYMAGRGYACVRVDIRGTGESEGVLLDEYLETEQSDAEDVLAWLADQPWCNGRLGMMGISWGAFAALQVAARRPPGLDAIVISSFTEDRYADDMHYMGGCMLSDNLAEAGTMFAYATCPPDPAVVGERWREMWEERLESSGPWVAEWLRHQHRDDYWRHASICEDYAAVRCAVLASSGWADGYSNAVTRLLEHLDCPRKGMVGPWSHKFPHLGEPGPAIGYLQEVVRWWDHWLKDVDNGAEDGPMLRAWMQESVPPSTSYEQRPGRWVAEPAWPAPTIEQVGHPLAHHRVAAPGETVPKTDVAIQSPLSVGQFAGKWASYNAPPDLPYDQREEDGGSLVFDSDELVERVEILGAALVQLDLSVSEPVAMIAARLSDVAPDGSATRVSYGLLNLTHHGGQDTPEKLEPGRRYRVEVELNGVAQAFPPGHRIRLSLSTSYWPLAWPPPKPVLTHVHLGDSSLVLPVRPVEDAPEECPFGEPEGAPPLPTTQKRPPEMSWNVTRDLVSYTSALETTKDSGVIHYDDVDLDVGRRAFERYSSVADDFSSVEGESTWTMAFGRGEWQTRTVTRSALSCTEESFVLHATLDAYVGTERIVSRNWKLDFPRRLV
jgi:putative CocE/NonD family hydrolase